MSPQNSPCFAFCESGLRTLPELQHLRAMKSLSRANWKFGAAIVAVFGVIAWVVRDVIVEVSADEIAKAGGIQFIFEVGMALWVRLMSPFISYPLVLMLGALLGWQGRKIYTQRSSAKAEKPLRDLYSKGRILEQMTSFKFKFETILIAATREGTSRSAMSNAPAELAKIKYEVESFMLSLKKAGFSVPQIDDHNLKSIWILKVYLETLIPFVSDHFEDAKKRSVISAKAADETWRSDATWPKHYSRS